MKILFLCGCLEPGKDGVGDYTRLLAKACAQWQHECFLISLNDNYVQSMDEETLSSLHFLRFKNLLQSTEHQHTLQKKIINWNPDIISLQFVPYSFHPKGFVHELVQFITRIPTSIKWHIMFHEIWIGCAEKASLKDKLVGYLQRRQIKKLLKTIQPQCMHSHTPAYQYLLKQLGYTINPCESSWNKFFPCSCSHSRSRSDYTKEREREQEQEREREPITPNTSARITIKQLPLFSNIPWQASNADKWLLDLLEQHGVCKIKDKRKNIWLLGIFGTIHPQWPPEPCLYYIEAAALKANKQAVIISFGQDSSGQDMWQSLSQEKRDNLQFIRLGPMESEKISQLINSLDFGVSTSPWSLIHKSGCAMAMLEHGLPVLINRDDVTFKGFDHKAKPLPQGIYWVDETLPSNIATIERFEPQSKLEKIAEQMLEDIKSK